LNAALPQHVGGEVTRIVKQTADMNLEFIISRGGLGQVKRVSVGRWQLAEGRQMWKGPNRGDAVVVGRAERTSLWGGEPKEIEG